MSILYDDAQQAIAEQSRRAIGAKADKQRQLGLLEQTGAFDQTFWELAIDSGWTAMALPERFGGLGLGLTELGLVLQAAGATTAGAPPAASKNS